MPTYIYLHTKVFLSSPQWLYPQNKPLMLNSVQCTDYVFLWLVGSQRGVCIVLRLGMLCETWCSLRYRLLGRYSLSTFRRGAEFLWNVFNNLEVASALHLGSLESSSYLNSDWSFKNHFHRSRVMFVTVTNALPPE
jgi:hypothetical protein